MQTTDPVRFVRGFGLAAGALLLVSGAVFASQAGVSPVPAADGLSATASAGSSVSPEASPSVGGVLLEGFDDDDGLSPSSDASASPDADDHDAGAAPGASGSPDDDDAGAMGSPEGIPSADDDDHSDDDDDDDAGPGGGDDDHDDDDSGPGGGDDHDDD
jgi:hypothetical protein